MLLARARPGALWTCASCASSAPCLAGAALALRRRSARRLLPLPLHAHTQTASFGASARRTAAHAAASSTHYDILELGPAATPADIKRQFYALSKKHHPDHNPQDPSASTRFVAISEAYHVLSVPEKRTAYDAHLAHARGGSREHHHHAYPSGSHFGSRPASGLNKKRSTFRGPPPSFYKAGGYGRHGAKRAEYQHHQHEHPTPEHTAGSASYGGFGEGFGPGQARMGNDVPHFDDRKHKQTHDTVYEHISARRRRERDAEIPQELDRGGMLANFVMVSGVIGIAAAAANMFSNGSGGGKKPEA